MGRILIAALAALMLTAAPAATDSDDDAFLNAMHSHNITNTDGDQGLIQLAHGICRALSQGASMDAVAAEGELFGNNASLAGAQYLVRMSAAAYCPQYIK